MGAKGLVMEELLGYVAEEMVRSLRRELYRAFRAQGLPIRPRQWVVLYYLWQKDGMPHVDLVERTLMDGPTISRMIDAMERHGTVSRRRCSDDRRAWRVHLTDYGRSLQSILTETVAKHHERVVEGISESDLAVFRNVAHAVTANMDRQDTHADSSKKMRTWEFKLMRDEPATWSGIPLSAAH